MKYITLVTQNAPFYWVRFCEGTNKRSKGVSQKVKHHKTFPFLRHGGWENALNAAKAYRDEIVAKEGLSMGYERDCVNRSKFYKTHKRNTTGVVGVSRVDRKDRNSCYAVQWYQTEPDGLRKKHCKSFGFNPENFDEAQSAFRNAVRLRKQMEKTHYTGVAFMLPDVETA